MEAKFHKLHKPPEKCFETSMQESLYALQLLGNNVEITFLFEIMLGQCAALDIARDLLVKAVTFENRPVLFAKGFDELTWYCLTSSSFPMWLPDSTRSKLS